MLRSYLETLKAEWSEWDERRGRRSREVAVSETGVEQSQALTRWQIGSRLEARVICRLLPVSNRRSAAVFR